MNLHHLSALALVAAACITPEAIAGQKVSGDVQVSISSTSHTANGTLAGARNSSDSIQRLGCQLSTTAGSTIIYGRCDASDALGNYVQCGTTEAHLLEIIKAIGPDTLVSFSANPAVTLPGSGLLKCQSITVDQNSLYEAKRH